GCFRRLQIYATKAKSPVFIKRGETRSNLMPVRALKLKLNYREMNMKKQSLPTALILLAVIAGGTGLSNVFAQTQNASPSATGSRECGESERGRLAKAQQASLTPAEHMAWREI